MYIANDVISTQEITSKAADTLKKTSKLKISIVPHMDTAVLLKAARTKRGFSQKDFAKQLGLPPSELCRLEKKSPRLSRKMLRRLSPFVGIPYSTLLANSGYSAFDDTICDYYSENGNVLDAEKIVADIYTADSKLLEDLSEIQNTLCYNDIQFLRLTIELLKIKNEISTILASKDKNGISEKTESYNFIQSMIHSLIEYVANQASSLINIYKRTLRI